MVWNSAGSTLYKAVERHNSAMEQPQQGGGAPQTDSAPPQKPKREAPPQSPQREKSAPDNCVHTVRQTDSSPLQRLMQDRDMLLILAVLLLLLHEKADTKLIIALAFVIFC